MRYPVARPGTGSYVEYFRGHVVDVCRFHMVYDHIAPHRAVFAVKPVRLPIPALENLIRVAAAFVRPSSRSNGFFPSSLWKPGVQFAQICLRRLERRMDRSTHQPLRHALPQNLVENLFRNYQTRRRWDRRRVRRLVRQIQSAKTTCRRCCS